MPILNEIDDWFSGRSEWQRKAYARLRSGERTDTAFIDELRRLCLDETSPGATKAEATQARGSDEVAEELAGTVRLLGIQNVEHINCLAPGQKLTFALDGLTAVYGDNGAGKSGYGRILRQVCQARGPAPELRGNVFLDAQPAGTAEVIYSLDGDERPPLSILHGQTATTPLRRFSIFDSGAAAVLIEQETDVLFRPFGLDLLDRFSGMCDEVRARLDGEIQSRSTPIVRIEDFPDTTAAGKFLRQLSTIEGRRRLDAMLSPLTADESQRRQELDTLLTQAKANDPKKLAQAANSKAVRFQTLADRLARISAILSQERFTRFAALCAESKRADEAAEVARTKAFANESLDGVGTDVWKRLWLAARAYASQSQPDVVFADGSPEGRCVLCAQPLTVESAKRFATLDAFVKGELQTRAENLRNQIAQLLEESNNLPIRQQGDDAVLLELQADDASLAEQCRDFVRRAASLASGFGPHFTEGHPLPTDDTALVPPASLAVCAAELRKQAVQFQAAATATSLAAQQAEFLDLEAKARFVARAADVRAEAARHERLALLEAAKKTTTTRGVSDLSKELTKKYVSDALCERFRDEVKRLGLQHLGVELAPVRAGKGTLFHRISLKAKQPAPMREVISEGEFRCLAIAAFLAEVGDSTAGILFDDPVSSLDHKWRERIARRLAEEARSRQVIVFTHDIVFHNLLRDCAAAPEVVVSFAERSIERRGGAGAGFCVDAPPWSAMRTRARIGVLKQRLVALKKQDGLGDTNFERDIRDWYGRLREAWERSVEECLLKEAVVRYRRSIQTKPLKEAIESIQPGDYAAIDKGMSRTSAVLPGHDDAQALNPPVPTPAEAEQDLADFEIWVSSKR